VEIRKTLIEDAPAVASLAGELGYPCDADSMRARLEHVFASEDDAVFVAVAGVAVVGWVHVGVARPLESHPRGEIRGLIVAAALRSRGIGARLVQKAEQWARSRGLAHIRVRSNVARERTHLFYERLGYTTIKSQKVFDKGLE
jgi:GNAT superfamily N-acetyltransferase